MKPIPATLAQGSRHSATPAPQPDRHAAAQSTMVGVEGSPTLPLVGVDGSPAAVDAVRWAAQQADRTGAAAETVTRGHPAEVLVAAAQGADRPEVGSGGQVALHRRLFGSVGEHVGAGAPCPVVVVRHVADRLALGRRSHLSSREVPSGAGFR